MKPHRGNKIFHKIPFHKTSFNWLICTKNTGESKTEYLCHASLTGRDGIMPDQDGFWGPEAFLNEGPSCITELPYCPLSGI